MMLLKEMRERGVKPNHRSFNAVMSAYGKAGQVQQAVSVLSVSETCGSLQVLVLGK